MTQLAPYAGISNPIENYQNAPPAAPPPPDPAHTDQLNRRVYGLLVSGHQWMGTQTLYALADSGLSDDEINQVAESMRQTVVKGTQAGVLSQQSKAARAGVKQQKQQTKEQTDIGSLGPSLAGAAVVTPQPALAVTAYDSAQKFIKQADDGFKHLFDDPVLQKHPSAMLALKNYLSGVLGPVPVGESDLKHSQKQLQAAGFGRDLEANGVNSPGWNAAFAQWRNQVYESQLQGNKPGSLSMSHAMRALEAITPVSAWNALVGFALQLPEGARQLLADAAEVYHGQDPTVARYSNASPEKGATAATIENFLGGDLTAKEWRNSAGMRALEDATNLLMVGSLIGAGSRFALASGVEKAAWSSSEAASSLTAEAAATGPGVIARSLSSVGSNPIIPRVILGAGLGGIPTAVAGGTPKEIAAAALIGGAIGGLSSTEVFQHIPVLGRTGPFIDSLADESGLYYKVREFAHQPYTWVNGAEGITPIKGAIGVAARLGDVGFQQSLILGGEARGLAQALDYLYGDGKTKFSSAVEGQHSIDVVNDAIKNRLGFTILGQHIAPSLNDLMFAFGGKGAEALKSTSSELVGAGVTHVVQSGTDALSEPGFAASIQRINGNKSLHKLIDQAGGIENYNAFWGQKIIEHSVARASEDILAEQNRLASLPAYGNGLSDLSRAQQLQQIQHDIYQDPELVKMAVQAMRAQSGGEELTVRLLRDKTYGALSPEGPQSNIAGYMDAVKHTRDNILPHVGAKVEGADALAVDHQASRMLINASEEPGGLGIAGRGTLTRQAANRQIDDFEQRWNDLQNRSNVSTDDMNTAEAAAARAARPTFDEYHQLQSEMGDYLYRKMGVVGDQMPHRGQDMIDAMRAHTDLLATEVFVHPDAPQALQDAVAALNGKGYKLVSGTDIGHTIAGTFEPIDTISNALTFPRRVAEKLGINPTAVPDANLATHRWLGMVNRVQDSVQAGRVSMPPYSDPVTVLAYLRKEGVIEEGRSGLVTAAQTFGARRIAKDLDISIEDARKIMDTPVQLRDTARAKIVDALSGPTSGRRWAEQMPGPMAETLRSDPAAFERAFLEADAKGAPLRDFHPAPFTRAQAEQIYRDIVRGTSDPGAYMLGASKIDDLFRASLGFAGRGVGNNPLGWAVANLPNKLIQLRNELRFDLSPAFSFRRWFKINVKLAAEGIEPVWDPIKAMRSAGTFDEDLATLERVRPSYKYELEAADSADRYIKSQDVFGLVSPALHEARAAGIWARKGLSDAEIDQKLVRTFEYGNSTVRGRSALERSTNFVFFPFSFDKTLYRNLGAYILDKPAQRLILTNALAAYDQFNRDHMDGSNPLATSFYTQHLPLLQEVTQLNAFAHGISLGEPGGINRPLLNLFLPQSWVPSTANNATLMRFLPVVKDFSRIYAEAIDQKNIAEAALDNVRASLSGETATDVPGGKWNSPGPRKSTLSTNAQMEQGYATYLDWLNANRDTLDHNASTHSAANKINFPMDPRWGYYAGQPITASALREIVHIKYPAFDPEQAIVNATSNSRAWNQYVLQSGNDKFSDGSPKQVALTGFADATAALGREMNKTNVSPTALAKRTDEIRGAAMFMAEEDPKFYALYNKLFRKILGPLERVDQ